MLVIDPFYRGLGYRFAKFFSGSIVDVFVKFFGDGEFYVKFGSDVSDEDVFVLLNMFPDPSFSIVRGIFYVHALKDLGASRVFLIAPYLAYSRQDKRFLPGECVSSRVVVKSFLDAGADLVITVDVHNPNAFNVFGDKFVNLSSSSVVANYIMEVYDPSSVFLISPDKGRISLIEEISNKLNVPYTWFLKQRDLETGEIIKHVPYDESFLKELVNRRNIAIIYDDIISTGGTISNIVKYLRDEIGFEGEIVTIFTHGIFLPNSIQKLYVAGVTKIVATDTIDNPFAEISVAEVIHEFIKHFQHR